MLKNSQELNLHRLAKTERPYLVFIRAGSKPRPSLFYDIPAERNYDLAINYYAEPHPEDALSANAEIVCSGGLAKMHGAKLLFETTGLHTLYEGVMFLDDDLELLFNLDDFFRICSESRLDMAQPSVTTDSVASFPITRHHPSLYLRTTNWVEIMGPYLARDFLCEMMHSFSLSISGWGLDIYWGHHLGDKWRAGIVDVCQMRHLKEIDLQGGAFYVYLKSLGVEPFAEMRNILQMLGRTDYVIESKAFMPLTQRIG